MSKPVVIAIDGPAGAGKSTVGLAVADRLGYFFFDTGVLYRAVALEALRKGIDSRDARELSSIASTLDVVVGPSSVSDGRVCDVILGGNDVSRALRSPEVNAIVSSIAESTVVRARLVDAQRRQVCPPGTVMVGRDIGTIVCPDADLKIYLDARAEERALRRARQDGDESRPYAEVLAGIVERDRIDSTRTVAPLAQAIDALRIQTDDLSIGQVVDRIVASVRSGLRTTS